MENDWQMAESFIARLNSRCKTAESYYNQLNQQKQQIALQLRALKAEIDELNSEIMLATLPIIMNLTIPGSIMPSVAF